MQILFQGNISFQEKLADLFERIIAEKQAGLTSLLVIDPGGEHQGNIYITDGKRICGADLRVEPFDVSSVYSSGYEALRVLCNLVNAHYQYVIGPAEYFNESDNSLRLRLDSIIDLLPDLPDAPEAVMKGSSLSATSINDGQPPGSSLLTLNSPKPEKNSAVDREVGWHAVKDIGIDLPFEEPEEPQTQEVRFVSLAERAKEELDPLDGSDKEPPPFIVRQSMAFGQSVKFFFINLLTAPLHFVQVTARPILLPLALLIAIFGIGNYIRSKVKLDPVKTTSDTVTRRSSGSHPVRSNVARVVRRQPEPQAAQKPTTPHTVALPSPDQYKLPEEGAPVQHRHAYQSAAP